MENGAGVLIALAALVVMAGLGVATRPRRAARRSGASRPRLAVRLRRRRDRVTSRLRIGWQSVTRWSTSSDGSAGSSSYYASSGYDGSSSHDYGGGGGGGGDCGGGGGGGGD